MNAFNSRDQSLMVLCIHHLRTCDGHAIPKTETILMTETAELLINVLRIDRTQLL